MKKAPHFEMLFVVFSFTSQNNAYFERFFSQCANGQSFNASSRWIAISFSLSRIVSFSFSFVEESNLFLNSTCSLVGCNIIKHHSNSAKIASAAAFFFLTEKHSAIISVNFPDDSPSDAYPLTKHRR